MTEAHRLPAGTSDQWPCERENVGNQSARLARLFSSWGYHLVEPPVFEYYETFRVGTPAFAEQRVYRFLDRDGRLLALRPEMTTGIARMVAAARAASGGPGAGELGRLPLRLAYTGPVFRNEPAGTGRPHSFWQAGVEFLGETAPEADAEVIAVASDAARAVGSRKVRVVVGHVSLAWKALRAAGRDPDLDGEGLRAIASNRDLVGLEDLLGREIAAIFASGPYGGRDARRALDRLTSVAPDLAEDAGAVAALLDAASEYGCPEVALDLSLLRDLDYYTGAVFDLLVPGHAEAVGGGGRYDGLVGKFGVQLPATGFALNLSAAAGLCPPTGGDERRVAVAAAGERERGLALRTARSLRGSGNAVELITGNPDLPAAINAATERGARRLLFFDAGSYREIDLARAPGDRAACVRPLGADQSIH